MIYIALIEQKLYAYNIFFTSGICATIKFSLYLSLYYYDDTSYRHNCISI